MSYLKVKNNIMSKKIKKYHHPILIMENSPKWFADEKGKLHLSDITKKEMEQTKKTQEMLLKLYKK
tara:strand:- start:1368 stop:1565 length:198 start_codon:yes stop_codon:yes gene_type:complete